MYNILVHDLLNKYKFVYNTSPIKLDQLYNMFDIILSEIYKSTSINELHVSYINETECDIYIYKEEIKEGWIWNSYVPEKKILFKIEAIACINLDYLFQEKSCQTEIMNYDKECQINTIDNSLLSVGVSCQTEEFDNISLTSDTSSNYKDFIEENDNNRYSNYYNNDFKKELNDRLNLENFGLYTYKYNKHKND